MRSEVWSEERRKASGIIVAGELLEKGAGVVVGVFVCEQGRGSISKLTN